MPSPRLRSKLIPGHWHIAPKSHVCVANTSLPTQCCDVLCLFFTIEVTRKVRRTHYIRWPRWRDASATISLRLLIWTAPSCLLTRIPLSGQNAATLADSAWGRWGNGLPPNENLEPHSNRQRNGTMSTTFA